ncbi:MAG: hypothetical protein V3575_03005, partial [Candidatus Absconditabacteria bacterium]
YSLAIENDKETKSYTLFQLSSVTLLGSGSIEEKCNNSKKYANESISINPHYASAYLGRAMSNLYCLGEPQLIEKDLEKSISLYKDLSGGYELLGMLSYDNKNYEKALKYFEESLVKADIDNTLMGYERPAVKGKILYFISLCNLELGNNELAVKSLAESIMYGQTPGFVLFIGEIQKENYGVFEKVKDDEKFKMILEAFNK